MTTLDIALTPACEGIIDALLAEGLLDARALEDADVAALVARGGRINTPAQSRGVQSAIVAAGRAGR